MARRVTFAAAARRLALASVGLLACFSLAAGSAGAASLTGRSAMARAAAATGTGGSYWWSNANYDVNEDVGEYPIQITRSETDTTSTICWGATIHLAPAGVNFVRVSGNQVVRFAPGSLTATVDLKIIDNDINGPSRYARIYMWQCGGSGHATVASDQILTLLQNDPLDPKLASNPLGYATPTDGDPLQNVNWFIWGTQMPAGRYAVANRKSHPRLAAAAHLIAFTPGSESYRYWMWGSSAATLAKIVEMQLANDELAQPGTTLALSTYSLVHGTCQNPATIKTRYENWIDQLARGIGNFRVVIYLEEDALMETGCLKPAQLRLREAEIAYAVRSLERDPHVVVYIDAGASDALKTPAEMARRLRASGVAYAQGFAVNSTHFQWTTTEVRWGQQISARLGGKHFVVQTGANGRGPLLNKHPATQGVEDLCAPPGRGLGVLTWRTGYKYVDGFLWYNNPGNAGKSCTGWESKNNFSPTYALGLVQRRVRQVTGPKLSLLRSLTDM